MKEIWNTRYAQSEYVYGKQPNVFFKRELTRINPGRILLPAEGEGRNAVTAAKHGWKVDAFDFSESAKLKAESLAEEFKVVINYSNSSIEDFNPGNINYDCIALIYVHLPSHKRKQTHHKLLKLLKPGGVLLLEGFSKKQLGKGSGGPDNIDMLFSIDELKQDFNTMEISHIVEKDIVLNEGRFHCGDASIIQLVANKK